MKKALCLLFLIAALASSCGCGDNSDKSDAEDSPYYSSDTGAQSSEEDKMRAAAISFAQGSTKLQPTGTAILTEGSDTDPTCNISIVAVDLPARQPMYVAVSRYHDLKGGAYWKGSLVDPIQYHIAVKGGSSATGNSSNNDSGGSSD